MMLVFFAGYCGAGAIQNYFAFSSMSLTALFKKIYHTPYHGLFPHLWFFTSGSTTWEWMHRIGDGLKKSFYIDGVLLPCFLVFTLISLAGMFLTMHRWYKRQTPQDTERIITFVILLCLTAVHIPHSLLYEPWSVERWDATYPGIIVLGAIGYYAAMEEKKGRVLHAVRNIQLEFLFCAILGARLVHLLVWL
ncbi:MAG: hypothetical protein N3B18_00645 [Desulfobacterota bacterium]|nr:hypothetical protein [Thermodesulfobacteriota bacterium]